MERLFNGATLGAYRIIQQVGEGGMAKVYKAYQPSMERYVALKVLPSHYAEDPQFVERFIREARTIARLEHKNILPVYDFGEEQGITYLAMRYVEGGTLKELLTKGRLSLGDTLDLMTQICSALDYAHRRNVVHRDVKPSNVMLDDEGAPYLMDFGIAKVLGTGGDLTATGAAIGTPAYMAPEQAVGGKVDGRTDIYALGVVLYEMVVGRVPFRADTPMAVLMAHLREPLPLPSQVAPGIAEPIEAVIIKALAKEPNDRYQTANELAHALQQAVQVSGRQPGSQLPGETTLLNLIGQAKAARKPPAPTTPLEHLDSRTQARLEQNYIDGLSAYWVRDWEKAQTCFQAVLAVDPTYKDSPQRLEEVQKQLKLAGLYDRAQEAIQQDEWTAAQQALRQVVSIDAHYQDAAERLKTVEQRMELRNLYRQAGELHAAEQWQAVLRIFERIQQLQPDYPDEQNLLESAKASLAEQQRLDQIKAVYQRGLQAMGESQWEAAKQAFEQVLAEEPGYGDTERLLARAQDELGKAQLETQRAQAAELEALAAEQQSTAVQTLVEEPTAQVEPEAELAATLVTERPKAETTPPLQTAPAPARSRRVGWVIGSLGALGVVAVGLGITAYLLGWLGSFGLAQATPTRKPAAQATPIPQAAPGLTVIGRNKPLSDENVFDAFDEAPGGNPDTARWLLDGQCERFTRDGSLVVDGEVRFNNFADSDNLYCNMFTGKGEAFPSENLWAFESQLAYASGYNSGDSGIWLTMGMNYDDRSGREINCGLRVNSSGELVKFIHAADWQEGQPDKVYLHQEQPAENNRWYTTLLEVLPETMAFRCTIDGKEIGVYQPEDPDALRELPIVRFIGTWRGPNVVARTLLDHVRLIPHGEEAPQPEIACPETPDWRAIYWNNPNLEGAPVACRNEPELQFPWGNNSPGSGVAADNFSARFERTIDLEQPDKIRFILGGDDGVRLFVDGELVIDEWFEKAYTDYQAERELSAGKHHLVVEYYELGQGAGLRFDWGPANQFPQSNCVPAINTGLVGWWTFDAAIVSERGGKEVSLAHDIFFDRGLVGPALRFGPNRYEGSGGVGVVPSEALPEDLSRFTIELWVWLDPEHPQQDKIERFVTTNLFTIRKEGDGREHFYLVNPGGQFTHLWSDFMMPRGEWLHVAGTYDGEMMRMYFNGELAGEQPAQGQAGSAGGLMFSSEEETLVGMLDEVGLYSIALSAEQIKLIYSAGAGGKCK